jgi:DNA-binding transcriptional ArsR family regulator
MKSYQELANLFHILAHPVRLQILDELRTRAACVCHLQILTNRPQTYVSQQLRKLRDAGMVIDEKEGQNVFYHLKNDTVNQILTGINGQADHFRNLSDCQCPICVSVENS